jgi:hypothetical protein
MMIFKIIFIHVLMTLPVYGEALFDWIMWKVKGSGSDKPISTYVVRPILFLIGGFGTSMLDKDRTIIAIAFYMIAAFLAFFPLLINVILGVRIGHLGNGWWDNLMKKFQPDIIRIWFFIWMWIVAFCLYYQYEFKYIWFQ